MEVAMDLQLASGSSTLTRGFNIVALVIAALEKDPDSIGKPYHAAKVSDSRATGSTERATPSSKGRSTELGGPHSQRQRIDGVLSPSPRRLSFGSEDTFMPDTAAEAILDFLPAPQALSMLARSRSPERRVKCSRYCLSRLDKMVTSLAAAEEAYHQERKYAKRKEGHADTRSPTKPGENALSSNALSSNARFSQLGDLKHLDLIYKTALSLAVRGKPKTGVLTRSGASRVARELKGLPAIHVRRVGQRLMGLLATGMLSNLAKRQVEDQSTSGTSMIAGIVTDCMHPSTAGNRSFTFRDSVDTCGLLGLERFPLLAIAGVCVVDTDSPIFVCLPKVQRTPIEFMPTSNSKWLRLKTAWMVEAESTDHWDDGAQGAEAPNWNVTGGLVPVAHEMPETETGRLASFKVSAVLARAFRSPCGRFTAGLVGLELHPASRGEGDRAVNREDLRTEWPLLTYNGRHVVVDGGTGVPSLWSMGVRPCDSRFCREWDVPSYTLVVFGDSELLRDPPVLRASNGKWKLADFHCRQRISAEWSRILGVGSASFQLALGLQASHRGAVSNRLHRGPSRCRGEARPGPLDPPWRAMAALDERCYLCLAHIRDRDDDFIVVHEENHTTFLPAQGHSRDHGIHASRLCLEIH